MKQPKYRNNFGDLFDEQTAPTPTTEKQFDLASKNLADEAIEQIYNILFDPDSADYVRLHAARILLSYGRGTPKQKIEATVTQPIIRPIILSESPEESDEQ
jgi:hypothetical protein